MATLTLVSKTAAPALPVPAVVGIPDLAVRNLSVRYGAAPPVFSGVDLTIRQGEQVALIGANGAGKSTLLKCCLGFVPPCDGDVMLFGEPLASLRANRQRSLRGGIGFVAQKHNLVPRLSVLSNVVHGTLAAAPGPRGWLQALAPRIIRARALQALDMVGLADLAPRRADGLSGGQSQRVAIARALVSRPRLILADEPAASLDPTAGEEVMATFVRVSRETGTTLVFTTHHLDHALGYAGRVIGLAGGGLDLDAPAASLATGGLRDLYG
ncbi:phosphonate ABC transporter ATP-binding protein [Bauldia litoralis]|uniref:phosphonate ABC transporter ATP-binding protein n=1 Tax=Bauldia litoralis TaxID=665467 RepID=UPI00326665B9